VAEVVFHVGEVEGQPARRDAVAGGEGVLVPADEVGRHVTRRPIGVAPEKDVSRQRGDALCERIGGGLQLADGVLFGRHIQAPSGSDGLVHGVQGGGGTIRLVVRADEQGGTAREACGGGQLCAHLGVMPGVVD
jgi:hypothetical protein